MDLIGCRSHERFGFLVLRVSKEVTLPQCNMQCNMPYTGTAFPLISEVKGNYSVCMCCCSLMDQPPPKKGSEHSCLKVISQWNVPDQWNVINF